MARYHRAEWRPLGPQQEPRLRRKNVITLHTMVGSLSGTDSYFRNQGYSGVESHFGVGHDGTVYQWQDTDHQADAQAEGNDNCISIETADSGPGFPQWSGSDVPAWTDAQLDAIVRLVTWLCEAHDIPKRLVPDSGDNRHGIGYHRQGVDPWREAGAEEWSSSYGKVCPGDRRIHQIKTIVIPRVRGEEDDMPDAREVVQELLDAEIEMADGKRWPVRTILRNLERDTDRAAIFHAVWRSEKLSGAGDEPDQFPEWKLSQSHHRGGDTRKGIAGLARAIEALASSQDDTIREAVHAALADVDVTVSYETGDEQPQ